LQKISTSKYHILHYLLYQTLRPGEIQQKCPVFNLLVVVSISTGGATDTDMEAFPPEGVTVIISSDTVTVTNQAIDIGGDEEQSDEDEGDENDAVDADDGGEDSDEGNNGDNDSSDDGGEDGSNDNGDDDGNSDDNNGEFFGDEPFF
jgi:hypothetical protein